MNRKGQAALEFLTTYAWAFLVILIMVGALAYFGILRPSKLLPDRCNFGSEFNCLDFRLQYTAQQANLRLQNGVGETITVDSVSIFDDTGSALCSNTNDVTHPSTNVTDYQVTGCDFADAGYTDGEKGKVEVTITYYSVKSGLNYPHEVRGDIFTTIT